MFLNSYFKCYKFIAALIIPQSDIDTNSLKKAPEKYISFLHLMKVFI